VARERPDLDVVRETLRDEREEVEQASAQHERPDVAELGLDPAYKPDDEGLEDLKAG
jgi:hypothetical protein